MSKLAIGTHVWVHMTASMSGHPGGVDAPLHAIVAGVRPDSGMLNLTVSDENGATFPLAGIELAKGHFAPAAAAYATMPGTKRLAPPSTNKDAEQVKAESTRQTEAGVAAAPRAAKTGDASTDPNNTAAGSMTDMQRSEGQNAGMPTTGGMTPKISADNAAGIAGQMTELEREQAANGTGSEEVKAKQKAIDDAHQKELEASAQRSKDEAARTSALAEAEKKAKAKAEQAMPDRGAAKPAAKTAAKKAAPAKKAPAKKAAAKTKR